MVCWYDCKEFIAKLNSLTGKTFRLPKETEWEFAAKGGNKSQGFEYSGSNNINEVSWYDGNSYYIGDVSEYGRYGTKPVMILKPNELGLYDMTGNVWEWCEELYDSGSFARVIRGGSWNSSPRLCRISYRYFENPGSAFSAIGLRLVLVP